MKLRTTPGGLVAEDSERGRWVSLEGDDDLNTYLRLYSEDDESPTMQNDDVSEDELSSGFEALVVPGGTA